MTDGNDDPALGADDLLAVAALRQDDIQAIDDVLAANSSAQWRKIAYVVGVAMHVYPDQFHGIPASSTLTA